MTENIVDLDPLSLDAQIAALNVPPDPPPAGAAPGAEGAPAGEGAPTAERTIEEISAAAEQWIFGAELIIGQAAATFAPNWEIGGDEIKAMARATAVALEAWFPGMNLPPKWTALAMVAMTAGAIGKRRRDPGTGKFMPLRLAGRTVEPEGSPAAPAAPAGGGGRGFSTST